VRLDLLSSEVDGQPRVLGGRDEGAWALEGLGAHVARGDGPLVGLFGEERTDEPDDSPSVGEDAHDVGASADLLVQSPLGDIFHQKRVFCCFRGSIRRRAVISVDLI